MPPPSPAAYPFAGSQLVSARTAQHGALTSQLVTCPEPVTAWPTSGRRTRTGPSARQPCCAADTTSQLDHHLVSGDRGELMSERVDDRPVPDVRLVFLGAAPRHRVAVRAPVGTTPTAHGRCLAPVGQRMPVDVDRQLRAHRRFPVDRRLIRSQHGEVQRTPGPAREPRTVEEDAGAVDELRVRARRVGEDAVSVDGVMERPDRRAERQRSSTRGRRWGSVLSAASAREVSRWGWPPTSRSPIRQPSASRDVVSAGRSVASRVAPGPGDARTDPSWRASPHALEVHRRGDDGSGRAMIRVGRR